MYLSLCSGLLILIWLCTYTLSRTGHAAPSETFWVDYAQALGSGLAQTLGTGLQTPSRMFLFLNDGYTANRYILPLSITPNHCGCPNV